MKCDFKNGRRSVCLKLISNLSMERKGPPRSIKLPETIEVFRNLNNAKRFAIDIGEFHLFYSNYTKIFLKKILFDFVIEISCYAFSFYTSISDLEMETENWN